MKYFYEMTSIKFSLKWKCFLAFCVGHNILISVYREEMACRSKWEIHRQYKKKITEPVTNIKMAEPPFLLC
uniref:Uncharacterized protein n=1 Tax=Pararge aegeria TaxID=116150 RepID=S4P878_9NEOP